jgi:YegS/Rv2252/BmrU family lipid kinase
LKILLVGNPISGGGRARRLAGRLARSLERRGHAVEMHLTGAAGEARRRAERIEKQLDRLVVVGGDGTLNEVLNGLEDPTAVPLCQLATGTANILAHDLKLPRRPEALAALLERGVERRLDLGLIEKHRFLMLVSAGFDAMVTEEIRRTRSGKLGYARYLAPIARVLRSYRPPAVRVRVDRRAPVSGELVVVSNTRNYGGLFTLADRARCDSGELDVCVLARAAIPDLLRTAARGLAGGISRQRGVIYLTGREISIEGDERVPVQVDGDYFGRTPAQIRLEPSRVRFIAPG